MAPEQRAEAASMSRPPVPEILLHLPMEALPFLDLTNVDEDEFSRLFEWLRQPETAAYLHKIVALVCSEVVDLPGQ